MFLNIASSPIAFALVMGGAALYVINNREEMSTFLEYLFAPLWDHWSERRIAKLHPAAQAKAKEFIYRAEKELGISLRVTDGTRTFNEQADLYAKGRTAPGRVVTNAEPGESYHNYGLAIDVVEIKGGKALWNNSRWEEIGRLGEEIGFEWGGRWSSFNDKPHFQLTLGFSTDQLFKMWKDQGQPKYIAFSL